MNGNIIYDGELLDFIEYNNETYKLIFNNGEFFPLSIEKWEGPNPSDIIYGYEFEIMIDDNTRIVSYDGGKYIISCDEYGNPINLETTTVLLDVSAIAFSLDNGLVIHQAYDNGVSDYLLRLFESGLVEDFEVTSADSSIVTVFDGKLLKGIANNASTTITLTGQTSHKTETISVSTHLPI